MCRFMVYLGSPCLLADLVTKPSRSLTRQSYDAKERLTGHGYLNGDGFGVGWYSPEALQHGDPTPCMFSSIQPAWNNRNLERLANKIISPLIFAHVRAAYPGIPVSDANCQPFVCGRYMWMHNGGVGGFHGVRRKLLASLRDEVYQQCPSFESDSAICFSLFMNRIEDPMVALPPEELVAKMEATINEINQCCVEAGLADEPSLLNFVVSDGLTVVSTRYCNIPGEQGASLYYASGSKFECADRESNQYFVRHSDKRGLLGIVASEPLTDESADWIKVPRNTMVVMSRYKGEVVDLVLVPINPSPPVARDISRSFKALASCTKTSTKVSHQLGSATSAAAVPSQAKVPLTRTPRHSMTGEFPILALAVDKQRLFSGSQCGTINVYDLSDFRLIRSLSGHSQTIFALTIHNNRLYSSSTRVVKIWDLDTYQLLSTLRYSDGDVFALALAQGRAVAGPAGTSIIRCNRPGTGTAALATAMGAVGGAVGASDAGGLGPGPQMHKNSPARSGAGWGVEGVSGLGQSYEGGGAFMGGKGLGESPNRMEVSGYGGGRSCSPNGALDRSHHEEATAGASGSAGSGWSAFSPLENPMARPSTRAHASGEATPGAGEEAGLAMWRTGRAEHGNGVGLSRRLGANSNEDLDTASLPPEHARDGQVAEPWALSAANGEPRREGPGAVLLNPPSRTSSSPVRIPPSRGSRPMSGLNGLSSLVRGGTPAETRSAVSQNGALHTSVTRSDEASRQGASSSGSASNAPCKQPNGAANGAQNRAANWASNGDVALAMVNGAMGGVLAGASGAAAAASQQLPRGASGVAHPVPSPDPRSLGTSPGMAAGWPAGSLCKATEATLVLTDTERMGHCSRVYALAMCDPLLCSGAGDAFVKVWSLETGLCVATLYGHKGGVMALLAVREQEKNTWRLFSGSRDNTIRVWDLATLSCITTLTGHTDDVLGLATGRRNEFYSASVDHTIRMWSQVSYECLRVFLHETASFLSIACTEDGVVTGSSDGIVRYWEVEHPEAPSSSLAASSTKSLRFKGPSSSPQETHALMEHTLRRFLRIRAVSTDQSKSAQEQAWKGATFLMGLLEDLGAEAKLVVAVEGTNPIVFGRIMQDPSRLTITICGHYDVADASEGGWRTDPFDLTAIDGYLYGRGVSDSKGPIIATLFAIKELVASGELKGNVVFVLDGMQESGCQGFREAVQANLEWFEGTGLILSPNGAWISDHHPCLIYGMRGLICLAIEVEGPAKDLHSGKDGGAFTEPMNDLVTVLSNLVDSNNMILIPGFYDDVKLEDSSEAALYAGLDFNLEEYKATSGLRALTAGTPKEVLQNRWRNPSLSIVGVEAAAGTWSLIPKSCRARVCIRHVPDQNPHRLVERFRAHVAHEFAKLRSAGNSIAVHVQHIGDWWLADPSCGFYKSAEKAIERQWGVRPMYVREGDTMPVVPFLERALGAPALLLPISQATDHMALQNEKLRWTNFIKGKDVMKDLLQAWGKEDL